MPLAHPPDNAQVISAKRSASSAADHFEQAAKTASGALSWPRLWDQALYSSVEACVLLLRFSPWKSRSPLREFLKRLNDETIHLPGRIKDRPDRDRLAPRFERFKSVA